MGTSVTPGLGQLAATGFAPSTALQQGYLAHRVVIPGVGSAFLPGDPDPLPDTDFYITSRRRTTHPWIAQKGDGPTASADISVGGQRLDAAIGHTVDGEIQIRLIDVVMPIVTVACDRDAALVAEGNSHLDDGTAFTTGGWTIYETVSGLTAPGWFDINGIGEVNVSGFILFSSGTWSGYIQKMFNGTEGGGAPFGPEQLVGVSFRVAWGLDTGPGTLFAEVNGTPSKLGVGSEGYVGFPNGSYDFWNMPAGLSPYVYNGVVTGKTNFDGELYVRLGGEFYGGSCNLNATFRDLQIVSCENIVAAVGEDRYITGWLADAAARQQLLGRTAYLEQSLDGGATWTDVVYSGFVKQLTLDQSLTYLLTLGDSGRGRRVSRAWAGLNPVADFIP